jgi:hypothetical protein
MTPPHQNMPVKGGNTLRVIIPLCPVLKQTLNEGFLVIVMRRQGATNAMDIWHIAALDGGLLAETEGLPLCTPCPWPRSRVYSGLSQVSITIKQMHGGINKKPQGHTEPHQPDSRDKHLDSGEKLT